MILNKFRWCVRVNKKESVEMISVIIPIYHGIQYIKKQVAQIEAAAANTNEKIEIIFSNDDSDTPLPDEIWSECVKIKVLETTENRGIQVARIAGLNAASGEYIHYLDQDDEITPDYYRSQLDALGDTDAVYCRCYNGKRQTYNYDRVFEAVFKRMNILSVCPVISPGQVMLRKKSIPDFWKDHILKNVGSDDYLLWLCMYGMGCTFSANQDILYTHVRNGNNYSSDILRTKKSDEEMADLLIHSGMFSEADCMELGRLPEKQLVRRYAPQRKDQVVLQILTKLLECYEKGHTLEQYFLNKNITRIAIYGAAVMGERIKGLLSGSRVTVFCFIDKNAPFIEQDIPVYEMNGIRRDFDAVVISLIEKETEVAADLRRMEGLKIYTIRGIVGELADGC